LSKHHCRELLYGTHAFVAKVTLYHSFPWKGLAELKATHDVVVAAVVFDVAVE